ncbi:hypothetical protein BDK51DRAFT_49529 [Blyttiomyces helicus]|uniref:Bacteriophage/plasmid primase P4 C-terminal domain-containing protein n=1 Tax=Blyttiomyces helicus TaxID=388810 RepID=A0A4P9VZX9_9FUNG|nr:hypothetical protein BDK51DRAFT_49529 [Blyttiomyces helicus]|eukprot:RKO83968.1 hypothetical protein BDK51DRAFT_49529 [Blyttiomyces helicus]
MNVLFQHNVQIINNNYGQSTDLDVKFDTILTIFPDDDELDLLIFKNVASYYQHAKTFFMQNTSDENLKRARELRFDHILKRLKDKDQNTTLHEAGILFKKFNPRFEENLDNNRYLLSFRNGVYDLKTGNFRKSSSLDYLTTTIDYKLPEIVDQEIHDEINNFIDSIMPNDSAQMAC